MKLKLWRFRLKVEWVETVDAMEWFRFSFGYETDKYRKWKGKRRIYPT